VKVLAYTSPARGHLYPLVPIMRALVARGHGACVVGLAGELGQLAPLGIAGLAIDPAVERNQLEDWRARTPPRAIASMMRTFGERAQRDAPDLERAIEQQDPDILVVDINCWGAAVVAEASGRPWAMYSPYLLPLPSRDTPAYGPGLAPLGGPLGSLRDALVRRVIDGSLDRKVMPALNSLRARYGLRPLDHFVDLLARPPLLLALTAEGFEYPRSAWPANVRMVGPMNWSPALPPGEPALQGAPQAALQGAPQAALQGAPRAALPPPPWLAEMRDPLVLVTCSTERQRDGRLVGVALEALPPAGMSVIATTAAHDPDAFQVPPGSRVDGFVPHDAVLARAACVVCHGGMGITQKALAAGVPVVVVPFGRDQMETARRVEFAKAGVRLSPRRLTPARLADAVGSARDCRAGAERVSRAYAQAGGCEAAADAIEEIGRGEALAAGIDGARIGRGEESTD
jgi:UDP:flavonoid glycosyltransferase YjiC (YdhE family)